MSLADFRRYAKLRMNSYRVLVFPCDGRMLKIRPNIYVSFRSSCSHLKFTSQSRLFAFSFKENFPYLSPKIYLEWILASWTSTHHGWCNPMGKVPFAISCNRKQSWRKNLLCETKRVYPIINFSWKILKTSSRAFHDIKRQKGGASKLVRNCSITLRIFFV